jgi:hypothetical protein
MGQWTCRRQWASASGLLPVARRVACRGCSGRCARNRAAGTRSADGRHAMRHLRSSRVGALRAQAHDHYMHHDAAAAAANPYQPGTYRMEPFCKLLCNVHKIKYEWGIMPGCGGSARTAQQPQTRRGFISRSIPPEAG